MKLIVALTTIVLVWGCSQPPEKDKNTKIFSAYIQKEFNMEIPDSIHYYFLVPKLVCKGCVVDRLVELSELINQGNKDKFTFITTNPDIFPTTLKSKINLLHDKKGTLDILNLEIANLTIVETSQNKINFIKPIYPDENHPLTNFIKIFN